MRRAIAFALTGVLLVGYPAAALAESAEQDTRTEALQVAQEGDAATDPSTPADSPKQGGYGSSSRAGGSTASELTQRSLATTGDPTSPLLVVALALGGVAFAAIGAATKVRGATERE